MLLTFLQIIVQSKTIDLHSTQVNSGQWNMDNTRL